MGFGLKGDSLPPTTGFPRCDLVLQHIPCHRTPCSNVSLFNFFLWSSNIPTNGTRVKTCKTQNCKVTLWKDLNNTCSIHLQQGCHFQRFRILE